jgi:uncharacterized phage protein gp47/JayE
MYESQTYETVLQRIFDRVSAAMDKREGSIIYDATAPASWELAILYTALDYILSETFADTASRDYLLRRAAEYGVYPKPAGYALLRAELEGADVPVGARFNLENEALNYVVVEHLDGCNYSVQCETIGAIGNRYFGDLIPAEGEYIPGLRRAELVDLLIPGEDEEETEHFRQAYKDSFLSRAFGGNRADYVQRVMALPGVGAVKVYPVWNHEMNPEGMIPNQGVQSWVAENLPTLPPDAAAWLQNVFTAAQKLWLTVGGTVKLVVLGANYSPASAELVNEVQTAIDPEQNHGEGLGIAPIGHVVNVFSAGTTTVSVSFGYDLKPGYNSFDDAKESIESVIDSYFLELAKTWMHSEPLRVYTAQITNRLLDNAPLANVYDVVLTIDGQDSGGAEAAPCCDCDCGAGERNYVTLPVENIPVRGAING